MPSNAPRPALSAIELQLEDQMKSLQNEQSVALLWLPKTFRLRI
jgi:hypothetical protein